MEEQDNTGNPGGLDPRTCLLCACAFSIVAACLDDLEAALVALALSLLLLPLVWKKRVHLARRLFTANLFILFLWFITPFTTPGDTLWKWGILNCTSQGVDLALLVTIKANALALVFLSLIAQMPLSSLGSALHALHCPEKLAWIFLLMSRNIQLLKDEWQKLVNAAKLRCFQPRNNMRTYRTIGSLFGILLIRAFERSRTLHEAMLLRAYSGKLPFCELLRYRVRDYLFWLCCIASSCLLIILECGLLHV